MQRLARYDFRDKRQPDYAENYFYWGLIAADPTGDCISPKDISHVARELFYADNHAVPPEYLVGFLYQCGTQAQLKAKFKRTGREESFDKCRARATVLDDDA
jgi:hypothetical protein